jgi:hypothetical protein
MGFVLFASGEFPAPIRDPTIAQFSSSIVLDQFPVAFKSASSLFEADFDEDSLYR